MQDRSSLLAAAKSRAASQSFFGSSLSTACSALFGDPRTLAKHGLPSGIILFLRLLWESVFCFGLIFAAQYHLLVDNIDRNHVRNGCRDGSAGANICGYDGLDVATHPPPVAGLGMFAYGACEEYLNATTAHSEVGRHEAERFGAFVRTPGAAFCATANPTDYWLLVYWFADLTVLLLFCERIEKLEQAIESIADANAWTTADYAVMLHGLKRGEGCAAAERALRADLETIGFEAESIDHIELGVMVREQTTTGHAFIVFSLETDRNRFYESFHSGGAAGGGAKLGGGVDGAMQPTARPRMTRSAADAGGNGVRVSLGPEPSNVRWEALEMLPEERALRQRHSLHVSIRLLVASTCVLVLVQWAKRSFTTEYAIADVHVRTQLANPSVWIFFAASLAIAVTACKVRGALSATHASEGHETQAAYEAGLMAKLSAAFVSNNVLMPIAVTAVQSLVANGAVISQSWYERTGFIIFALVLMTIQRVTADLPRALQLISVTRRFITSHCAPSDRLQQMWEPPDMRVAVQFAQLYWLHACALLYGPLSPFFYALAAGYSLFSFACTKIGVVFWYKRPPAVNAHLGASFRRMLVALLPLHLVIKLIVRLAAESDDAAPYTFGLFLCGLGVYWYFVASYIPASNPCRDCLGGFCVVCEEDSFQLRII